MSHTAASRSEHVRVTLARRRDHLLAQVRVRAGRGVDPEDVVQIAAERALARSEQLRDPERVDAWLARIARNVFVDELRKRPTATVSIQDIDVSEQAHDEIDCWCVLAQAQHLKPEYAFILKRVVVDGVPVTQLASELGLTSNNAMVRLHRARRALRERMREHCGTIDIRSCSECGCEERRCCA